VLRQPPDPRTPKEASLFAQETVEKVMQMSFDDDIRGVVLTPPPGGPKRYVNLRLKMAGMDLVATFDMKAPGWVKASGPTTPKK
jgi:hypothetical protein